MKSSHTFVISTWQAGCSAFIRSGRFRVMYAICSRFSYLMNSNSMPLAPYSFPRLRYAPPRKRLQRGFARFASLPNLLFLEQFKKSIDTLHQLTANLRARPLDEMHRDAA